MTKDIVCTLLVCLVTVTSLGAFKVHDVSFSFETYLLGYFCSDVSRFVFVASLDAVKVHCGSFSFESYDSGCISSVVSFFILSVLPLIMFQSACWKFYHSKHVARNVLIV